MRLFDRAWPFILADVAIMLLGRKADATWFFLWLFATINLMAATGYFLYSGVADIGDWSVVIRGWSPVWFWRVTLALIGYAIPSSNSSVMIFRSRLSS